MHKAVVPPLSYVREDVLKPYLIHKNDLVNSCGLYFWELVGLVRSSNRLHTYISFNL